MTSTTTRTKKEEERERWRTEGGGADDLMMDGELDEFGDIADEDFSTGVI